MSVQSNELDCSNATAQRRFEVATTLSLRQALSVIRKSELPLYVYLLLDDSGTPFYVGKGTRDRICSHETEARDTKLSTAKHDEIRRLWASTLEVRYHLVSFHATDQQAHAEERHLIKQYGRRNRGTGILTNLTDGGEGHSLHYKPKQWEVDAEGVLLLESIVLPSVDQLAPPLFPRVLGWIWNGESFVPGTNSAYANPSGSEIPSLAFWQHEVWTVQAFCIDDRFLIRAANVEQAEGLQKQLYEIQYGRHYCGGEWRETRFRVLFRLFEGAELLVEDNIGVSTEELHSPSQLVVRVLTAIASPVTSAGRARICPRFSSELSKWLQEWIKHRAPKLSQMANALENNLIPEAKVDFQNKRERHIVMPLGPDWPSPIPCLPDREPVAFWQHADWTVHVRLHSRQAWLVNDSDELKCRWSKRDFPVIETRNDGSERACLANGEVVSGRDLASGRTFTPGAGVMFRFFVGPELFLEDGIAVPSSAISDPLRLVALVLRALAAPKSIDGELRACPTRSLVDFSERLRAWCVENRAELCRTADALNSNTVVTCNDMIHSAAMALSPAAPEVPPQISAAVHQLTRSNKPPCRRVFRLTDADKDARSAAMLARRRVRSNGKAATVPLWKRLMRLFGF